MVHLGPNTAGSRVLGGRVEVKLEGKMRGGGFFARFPETRQGGFRFAS